MRTETRIVLLIVFFFNDTATTEIYTLSLHDALPISRLHAGANCRPRLQRLHRKAGTRPHARAPRRTAARSLDLPAQSRSEEHTSELQSHLNLVCPLLLQKKKQFPPIHNHLTLTPHPS